MISVNRLLPRADWKQWKAGTSLLTVVKCFGLVWSANPCKLVFAYWDEKLPREMVKTSPKKVSIFLKVYT